MFEPLLALNRLLAPGEPLEVTLQGVIEAACEFLPNIDVGSVTVQRSPKARTVAFSHADAIAADAGQYEAGDGPCLVAMRDQRVVRTVVRTETQWPLFVEQARHHRIESSLSLPLALGEMSSGALNLYSRDPSGAIETSDADALLFAKQASIAIANSILYQRSVEVAQHLEAAIDSRDLIGQAKGILMAQRRVSADEAFQLLADVSQRRNIKLVHVAEQVTATGTLDAP